MSKTSETVFGNHIYLKLSQEEKLDLPDCFLQDVKCNDRICVMETIKCNVLFNLVSVKRKRIIKLQNKKSNSPTVILLIATT